MLEEDEEVHEEDDLEEGMRRGISHSSDELREQDFDYFIGIYQYCNSLVAPTIWSFGIRNKIWIVCRIN